MTFQDVIIIKKITSKRENEEKKGGTETDRISCCLWWCWSCCCFNDTFKNKNKTLSVVSASMAIRLYRTKQANSLTQYQYSKPTMGKTRFEKNSCETIVNDTLNSIKSISKLLKFARLKGETTKFYNEKKIKTKYHSHLSTSSLTATL